MGSFLVCVCFSIAYNLCFFFFLGLNSNVLPGCSSSSLVPSNWTAFICARGDELWESFLGKEDIGLTTTLKASRLIRLLSSEVSGSKGVKGSMEFMDFSGFRGSWKGSRRAAAAGATSNLFGFTGLLSFICCWCSSHTRSCSFNSSSLATAKSYKLSFWLAGRIPKENTLDGGLGSGFSIRSDVFVVGSFSLTWFSDTSSSVEWLSSSNSR